MFLFKLFIFGTLFNAIFSIEEYICEGNTLNLDCPAFTYLHIYYGNYGRHNSSICPKQGLDQNVACSSSNTTQILLQRCDGKNNCTFVVSNEIFSDPCVGTYKYLELNYSCERVQGHTTTPSHSSCGPNELPGCTNFCIRSNESCNSQSDCNDKSFGGEGCICKEGYLREPSKGQCVKKEECPLPTSTNNIVCEDQIVRLECPPRNSIKIVNAIYGRHNSTICPKEGKDQNTNCSSTNATQILQNRCDGELNCTLTVSNQLFSDPCIGTYKYLEVNYTCNPFIFLGPGPVIIPQLRCDLYEEIGYNNACIRRCEGPQNYNNTYSNSCGCVCSAGYKRDYKTNKCVDEKYCPQPGTECETHEVYSECGAGFQPTCGNMIRNPFLIFPCVPGYVCAENYVRDPNTNRCVPSKPCPRPVKL